MRTSRLLPLVLAALLGAVRADAVKITEYPIPTGNALASDIVAGPDGRLWFAEGFGYAVGAVTTEGVFSEFPVQRPLASPRGIAVIPGRALVFTEINAPGLGFVSVNGSLSESPGLTEPIHAAFGLDGRIWVVDLLAPSVSAFHYLATSPNTATYGLSGPGAGVVAGPDGRMWVTEDTANKVAACPIDGGQCAEYPVPGSSLPEGIAVGTDGNLWFTEYGSSKIGRMTTAGVLTEFPLPTPNAYPLGICAGPDGNLWFTEFGAHKVGRITKQGVITEYDPPTPGSAPYAIAAGPDGNVWFTEQAANKIAKIRLFVPGDADGDGNVAVADLFYLINYLFAGGPAPK